MDKQLILDKCSELFDRLTIIRGYLRLNTEKKNIDYSLTILYELNQIEKITKEIVDVVKILNPISDTLCLLSSSRSKNLDTAAVVHYPKALPGYNRHKNSKGTCP